MAKGAVTFDGELKIAAQKYCDDWLVFHDYEVHLYVNDHSPTADDTLADYVECALIGYAAQLLIRSGWSVADPLAHAVLIEQATPRRFFPLGITVPTLVYGYYVTDEAGALAWAEAFTLPQTIGVGQWIDVRAKIRYANCPAC